MASEERAHRQADRATHEPSPDGLGHSVSVPCAVPREMAAMWLQSPYRTGTDDEWLADCATRCIARFGRGGELRSERDRKAVALLRQQMIDRAIRIANPGDSSSSVARAANDLLDAVIGRV